MQVQGKFSVKELLFYTLTNGSLLTNLLTSSLPSTG